ncbi:response regulator [Thalassobaculum sp. OXR-137]|uniref:response regulator n=1 Tax=Thalassobaculum sp. OXR-137 TaxID=3100173 RepID=UPI002AC965B1|nr:response regulator [Thalassobaculum sp. OXR-137]WPZ34142.1 response regulator [Thalassobaculum sp. OXR-137]
MKGSSVWRAVTGIWSSSQGQEEPADGGSGNGELVERGCVRLGGDGRFLEADAGAVALLGDGAATGEGKAVARLRLMVLKRDPAEAESTDSFDHEGRQVAVTLTAQPEDVVQADLSAARKPAEQPPETKLELVVDALEYAPIGALRIDEDDRIVGHNRFLSEWLGPGGRNAMLGSEFLPLVAEQDRARVRQVIADADPTGETSPPIDVTVGAEERERVASMFVRRPRGNPTQRVIYLIDVSDQRSLEMQFAQSQKMQAVGQLAGGVAHDFNNLLTAMTGYCDLLLQRHRAGDQSFADVMQIKQNANRAANLGRQLLAFSRQQTLIPRVVDLTEILSDLSHLLRRLIGETVVLELEHGRDLRPVRVDPGQLEQVIINLVVNARDAMPGGGRISMRTGLTETVRPLRQGDEVMPPGEYVLIEVIDTGTGMPPDVQKRIFEPFFTTKDLGQGTGLGLSTAFGIIKQFGGYMFVDSTLEVGTTFSIYLPAWNGAVEVNAADGPRRLDTDLSGTGTVLLVEDEDPVRLFAARALRGKGYTVLEARSGEAALELLNGENPQVDLMVTDVMMPGIDGPTLIREVRKGRPKLPVVCISGYSEDALRQRIADAESVAFLPKPFSLKQLAQAVKHASQPVDPGS